MLLGTGAASRLRTEAWGLVGNHPLCHEAESWQPDDCMVWPRVGAVVSLGEAGLTKMAENTKNSKSLTS